MLLEEPIRTSKSAILVIEHLEEDLAGDVVWVVASQDEWRALESPFEMHLQEVVFDDVVFEVWIVFAEIFHAFVVYLDHFDQSRLLNKVLSHHSHAWSDFQDGQFRAGIDCVGNARSYAQIGQKVLSEELFWLYSSHSP